MRPKLSKRRLAILVALVLFAIAVFIASVIPNHSNSVLRDHVQDSGHVVVFAIVAVVAFGFGRSFGLTGFVNYLQSMIVAIVCGVGIEAVQYPLPHRDASIADVVRDTVGAISGLLVVAGLISFRQATAKSWLWRVPLLLVALALFLAGVFPAIECLWAKRLRYVSAPTLMSTEHFWWKRYLMTHDANWWIEETPNDWPNDPDNKACYVHCHATGEYPGVSLREPTADWSKAKQLTFDVYSHMEKPFRLVIRVNDRKHHDFDDDPKDRYNGTFEVQPKYQTISIPLSTIQSSPKTREMEMNDIDSLFFFLPKPQEIRMMIDNVRLE